MSIVARDEYLTQEVMTAPPQKLQLMLIEGAIRFGERARYLWSQNEDAAANEALVRCQDIMSELLSGLAPAKGTELAAQMGAIYLFIYRRFMEASVHRDEQKLNDALRILHEERETWRQLCIKLSGSRPHVAFAADEPSATGGLSFEA